MYGCCCERGHWRRLLWLLVVSAICLPMGARGAGRVDAWKNEPRIDGTVALGRCTVATVVDEVRNLDESDPGIRQRTRELLMTLGPQGLPMLREAVRQTVRQTGPLSATQVSLLRDVVCQIVSMPEPEPSQEPPGAEQRPPVPAAPMPGIGGQILGGQMQGGGGQGAVEQNAEQEKNEGFIGVCLARDDEESEIQPNIGATVEGRIPGLVAYRMLCDGDVIDSIMVPGVDSVPRFLVDHDRLKTAVNGLQPGRVVVLGVMRGGRHLQIKLALDCKTDEILREEKTGVGAEELIGERLDKGLATWEQQFAPIVDDGDPSSGSARAD
jgi:hypothetical protein